MAVQDIYLGPDVGNLELLTPLGRTFTKTRRLLARTEQTASGRLVRDVIATKLDFTLSYSLIDGDELETIIDQYDELDELVLRVYNGASTYDDYDVLMEPFEQDRVVSVGGGLWGNVQIVLKEV